jgi:hypothetical protein
MAREQMKRDGNGRGNREIRMNKGAGEERKVPSGSSWRILVALLPMVFTFIKAIIFHPNQAFQIFKMGRAAKKQVRHIRQREETELPYKIPVFKPGMKFCKSQEKYLRPSRLIESEAPEIIAMANQLGAFQMSDKAYADHCFMFIQRNIRFSFASPLRGARQTLITGEGNCLGKANLFIALCRTGHIPARLKTMNTALTQQIYEVFPGEFPIVKDLYDANGYFELHTVAEAFVDGKWQVADSIDDRYQATMGLPLVRFGDDPQGKWNWEVPGGTYSYEKIPWLFEVLVKAALKINRGLLSFIQAGEAERLEAGRRILEEMGGEEAYDRKVRQTYKAKLPEVSKRLFTLLSEEERLEKGSEIEPTPEKGRRHDR